MDEKPQLKFIDKKFVIDLFNKFTIRRIFIGLIILRFAWYLRFIYYEFWSWVFIAKHNLILPLTNPLVILALLFEVIFFLLVFSDIKTLLKLKMHSAKYRQFSFISCICIFMFITRFVILEIVELVRVRNAGYPNQSWLSLYRFSFYDSLLLIVLATAIVQLLFLFKYKDKLIYRTSGLAEPFYINGNCEEIEVEEENNHED